MNAIELLKKDHRTVESLFESFEKAKEKGEETSKAELFASIKEELDAHARAEEEIFYPAFDRAAGNEDDKELVLEAGEEHKQVKTLLAELEGLDPGDETFDAKMKVLKDNIEHHVKEEEGEMFPHAQKQLSADALEELGQRIAARKEQLQQQPGRPAARVSASRSQPTSSPSSRARATAPGRRSGRKSSPTGGVRASDGSGSELLESMDMDTTPKKSAGPSGSSRASRGSSRGASSRGGSRSSGSRRSSSSGSSRSRSGPSGSSRGRSKGSSSSRKPSTSSRRGSSSSRGRRSSGRGRSARG